MTNNFAKFGFYAAALLSLTLGAGPLRAAVQTPAAPVYVAEPAFAVRIDGNLDDAAWKNARPLETFQKLDGKPAQAATTGLLFTDADFLYLAFRCAEPQMEKLQVTPQPQDGEIWNNDCLEIFIAPFLGAGDYYHLIVDAAGQRYDAFKRDGKEESGYELSITAATQRQHDSWTCEMAVPLADVGLSHARDALMNFARERKPVSENTSWHGGFSAPEMWQRVPLALSPRYNIDVRDWSFSDAAPQYGENVLNIEFAAANTPVKVLLYAQETNGWTLKNSKAVAGVAGRSTHVALPFSLAPRDKARSTRWVLESGGQPVFRSTHRLQLPADALSASLSVPYYYAEEDAGFVQLETFLSKESLVSCSVRLTVKSPDGKVATSQTIKPLRKAMTVGFNIAGWPNGTGQLIAELLSDGQVIVRRQMRINKRPGPFSKSVF